MSRRKVATTVYLDPSQVIALRLVAQAQGRPVADLVRDGIDLVLEAAGQPRALIDHFDRLAVQVRQALAAKTP